MFLFPGRMLLFQWFVKVIEIKTKNGTTTNNVTGRARRVEGRSAQVSVNGPVKGKIVSVNTIGKGDMTCAEIARQGIILDVLQGQASLLSQPFFQRIWLPHERTSWPKEDGTLEPSIYFPGRALNISQEVAVEKILSSDDDNRVVAIHGPPGTGKTTVIAAAVSSFHLADHERFVWIAAQSNVAVKNIAEKLCDVGFHDFKILVSKDFHFDWCVRFPSELLSLKTPIGMSIYTETSSKRALSALMIFAKTSSEQKGNSWMSESYCAR